MTRPPLRDSAGSPVFHLKRGARTDRRGRSTKRDNPEHRLQCAVATYLTWALPADILWTSTLNGAHLGPSQRQKMKAAGLRPGIPDLVFLFPNGRVRMAELKAPSVGTLSAEQKAWRNSLGIDGWALVRSVEDMAGALIDWGVTPRVPINKANRYAT